MGARVARLRRLAGVTVAELLARANAGVSGEPLLKESTVRNLEAGRKRDVTLNELVALSRGLRLPLSAILSDHTRPFDASDVEPFARLGMTNRDVAIAFAAPGLAGIAGAAGGLPSGIAVEAAAVDRLLAKLEDVCHSSLALREEWVETHAVLDGKIQARLSNEHVGVFFDPRKVRLGSGDYERLDRLLEYYFVLHAQLLETEKNSVLGSLKTRLNNNDIPDSATRIIESNFEWMRDVPLMDDPQQIALAKKELQDSFELSESINNYRETCAQLINDSIQDLFLSLQQLNRSYMNRINRKESDLLLYKQYVLYFQTVCVLTTFNNDISIVRKVHFYRLNYVCKDLWVELPHAKEKIHQLQQLADNIP